MEPILKTNNLTKVYDQHVAVNRINMSIHKGEIYGFLGQNGAGKTTAIRMMLGLVKPTSGEVEMFGERVTKNSFRAFERVGAIIETPGSYKNLTAYENLDIHRRLMGMSAKSSIEEALELVGLLDVRNRKVGKFSLGMKQRLGLARALLHQPDFLILDEPTNGLDPQGIKDIRYLLLDLAKRRDITILVSSHILSEIEQLATRIGIIHQGQLLEELDMEQLRQKNRHFLEVTVSNDQQAAFILQEHLGIADFIITELGKIRIYERMDEAMLINRTLVEHGVDIAELLLNKGNLEEYFLQLTGGNAGV
ncbi:bacitracin ABC transporter ATP-binding protein [Paenibacillus sp. CAA11]|uniref:ABC transporter ATP-binding protein n=1 Tax=Paenibacillus sp. CAA11 TaxID=1532905 RepID=UPI000D341DB7|nr:ABC transporter ATP-binding protein [Paenibacillus sp. CAA11]AWB46058.1 bacitracin ABC transporter ATP-binding protein [Paenibacillus sp. CAA11]